MQEQNNPILKNAKKGLDAAKKFFKSVAQKISAAINGEQTGGAQTNGGAEQEKSAQEEPAQDERKEQGAATERAPGKDGSSQSTESDSPAESAAPKKHGRKSSKKAQAENAAQAESGAEKTQGAEDKADGAENSSAKTTEKAQKARTQNGRSDSDEPSSFAQNALLCFLAFLDIAASLVFIAAIVAAIKPALLQGSVDADSYEFSSFVQKFGNAFLRIEFSRYNGSENLRTLQACVTGVCLIIFSVLKIFIFTAARNGTRKIISALSLAMTLLACFMMSDKFLLFAIFILLLHIIFEYSCGFPTALVFIKLGVVVAAALAIYVAVHFAFDPALGQAASRIFAALKLPALRWW